MTRARRDAVRFKSTQLRSRESGAGKKMAGNERGATVGRGFGLPGACHGPVQSGTVCRSVLTSQSHRVTTQALGVACGGEGGGGGERGCWFKGSSSPGAHADDF